MNKLDLLSFNYYTFGGPKIGMIIILEYGIIIPNIGP